MKRDRLTRCRVCGCTEADACPEGCSWAEADLCSVCAEAAEALVTWFLSARQIDISAAAPIRWFKDSPEAGEPGCLCSYCGERIEARPEGLEEEWEEELNADEGEPVRMWTNAGISPCLEARFHLKCLQACAVLTSPRFCAEAAEALVTWFLSARRANQSALLREVDARVNGRVR